MTSPYNEALKLMQKENWEEAANIFKEILAENPDDFASLCALGNISAQQKKWGEAIAYLQKALSIDSKSAITHNNLANLFTKQNKLNEALQHYAQALNLQPDFIEAHFNLGLLFLRQNKWNEAIIQFKNVVSLQSDHVAANLQLANLYLQQEEIDKSEKIYHFVLQYDPENTMIHTNLGVIALKKNQPQQAIDHFTRALAYDDNNLIARNNIAATFMQYDRFENALRHYGEYLKAKPEDIEANFNTAVAWMFLGKLQTAIEYFNKVLSLKPNYADAHTNLGAIYVKLQQYPEAIHHYELAHQLQPDNPATEYMLAALQHTAHFEKAPHNFIKNLFDNYAVYYDKHLQQLAYDAPRLLYQAIMYVTQNKQEALHICDIGCGTGLIGAAFKRIAKTLIGVDLSRKMLEAAKQKNIYDDLILSDINEHLKNHRSDYDLITAGDVFCYVGDLKNIFESCYFALSNDGMLAFTIEKNQGDEDFYLQKTARFSHSKNYIHQLSQQTGFDITYEKEIHYRKQDEQNIPGYLFILKKIIHS